MAELWMNSVLLSRLQRFSARFSLVDWRRSRRTNKNKKTSSSSSSSSSLHRFVDSRHRGAFFFPLSLSIRIRIDALKWNYENDRFLTTQVTSKRRNDDRIAHRSKIYPVKSGSKSLLISTVHRFSIVFLRSIRSSNRFWTTFAFEFRSIWTPQLARVSTCFIRIKSHRSPSIMRRHTSMKIFDSIRFFVFDLSVWSTLKRDTCNTSANSS